MITVLVLMTFVDETGLHKAGSITKVKEDDFNPSYMKKIDVPSGSSELSELDDVDISGVTDGEVLTYDAATEKWINATGGGGGSTITNIYEDTTTGNVASMDIDGSTYEFGAGETTIENVQTSSTGSYVQSMDIDSDTYTFSTVENDQPAYDSDILASVDLNGNSYKLFYLDNFQYNNDNYVTSFDDGDSNNYAFCDVGNVVTNANDLVESIDINNTTYNFATGGSVIENIVENPDTSKVASMDIDETTYNFVTGLEELYDVDTLSVSNGDALIFDAQQQKWVTGVAGAAIVVTLTKYSGNNDIDGMAVSESAVYSTDTQWSNVESALQQGKSVVVKWTNGMNLTFFATIAALGVGYALFDAIVGTSTTVRCQITRDGSRVNVTRIA